MTLVIILLSLCLITYISPGHSVGKEAAQPQLLSSFLTPKRPPAAIDTIMQAASKAAQKPPQIKKRGLVIIDVQNDFIGDISDEVGSLSVFENAHKNHQGKNAFLGITATEYANRVAAMVEKAATTYDFIVYSFDFHPKDHCSFWTNIKGLTQIDAYDRNVYLYNDVEFRQSFHTRTCKLKDSKQYYWPPHCQQGTKGARLHDAIPKIVTPAGNTHIVINVGPREYPQYTKSMEDVWMITAPGGKRKTIQAPANMKVYHVYKGYNRDVDSYSAFYGFVDENERTKYSTLLHETLMEYEVGKTAIGAVDASNIQLDMIGIAYDVCVANTAIDAAKLGYKVNILDYFTASVTPENLKDAPFASIKPVLKKHGVNRIGHNGEILEY